MRARARLVVAADPDRPCRILEMRDAAPIGLRPTAEGVYLVSTAQGLLDEDELALDVVVGEGATLVVRSVAASLAYASQGARLVVSVSVAPGAYLDWAPEPLIATQRCRVTVESTVSLAAGASLAWTEECLLGRFDEAPGAVELGLNIDYGGAPLVRHRLAVGDALPGFDGPAVLGPYRAAGCRVLAGARRLPSAASAPTWAVLALEGPGVVVSALGPDLAQLRARFAEACAERTAAPEQVAAVPIGSRG